MTLRERLVKFVDEINNAATRHKNHWEPDRAAAMLDIGIDLKRILEEYPDEEHER